MSSVQAVVGLDVAEALAKKIAEELKKEGKTVGRWRLPFFLAKILSSKEFEVLEKMEKLAGEENANDWLADVMVRSGKYERDAEGNVSPKEGA